jgi:nicotinate-nucleotide adenylyltransferase
MQPCDIEDELPRPSYTFNTLRALRDKYPDYQFSIIAGDDILSSVLSWKNSDEIVAHHDLVIKNRSNATVDVPPGIRAQFLPGIIELSATEVRGMIANGIHPLEIIPEAVHEYIKEKGLYGAQEII